MPVATKDQQLLKLLQDKATLLRIHSIRSTTAAGSGHPTSSASAADILSVLFFSVMRYDPKKPRDPNNDFFILSKGHAAPVLYAAWAEAGLVPVSELLNLRKITSDLEGHPTPRLPFADVATGSLGQGLCVGVGMALNARVDKRDQRIYVLLGDGESAEGSVWGAAEVAARYKLNNLCATIDVNRLGQSEPTMLQHDLETYRARWTAFGWKVWEVDGHDISELLEVYEQAAQESDRPCMILARTIKGKGIAIAEDREGFHGKALKPQEADEAIRQLEKNLNGAGAKWTPRVPPTRSEGPVALPEFPKSPYALGGGIATRQAFGEALAAFGREDDRIVALDADVKNSSYTEDFEKACPERFFQMYIAEQNMVGAAMGFAARGKIPFASTFACFLTRAYDFIRMAAISGSNIKLVGSHAGVSIGEDGPSQMALEDLAMTCVEPDFTVLYPCDGSSAWHATRLVAENRGPAYIRTSRPKTPVIYGPDEAFAIGKCKILRRSDRDRATVVGGGITVFEALKASEELGKQGVFIRVIDIFSLQPIDREALVESARATGGNVITVEDHYAHGGIGDAVLAALSGEKATVHKLAVREIPRSGTPEELVDHYGISARHIIEKVKELV
jgi:transketolase